jgi:hypothetical protein
VRAETEVFDAQVALEENKDADAAEALAYRAMLSAARSLVRSEYIDVGEDPEEIVHEWKTRFFDTGRFNDRFAGAKFGRYLLDRHADTTPSGSLSVAARYVEEAQLFVEAAVAADARLTAEKTAIVEPSDDASSD